MDKKIIVSTKKINDKILVLCLDYFGVLGDADLILLNEERKKINNISIKINILFDIVCFPNKNIFGIVHYGYNDKINKSANVFFNFYEIDKDNNIIELNNYFIKSESSCNNVEFKLSKIDNDFYSLVWGDLTNNNYCDFIYFNNMTYTNYKKIENVFNIDKLYFINENMFLECNVIGYDNNLLGVKLQLNNKPHILSVINKIKLPFTHKYKNPVDLDDESELLIFDTINNHCLVKINLIVNINPLKIEDFYILVLFDYKKNKILDITEKLYKNYNYIIIEEDKIKYENIEIIF